RKDAEKEGGRETPSSPVFLLCVFAALRELLPYLPFFFSTIFVLVGSFDASLPWVLPNLFVGRTWTSAPLKPGTAPRTSSSPWSASIRTTARLRTVIRSLP